MTAKLSFLGAAQNVTGSKYLLEVDGQRILVDCGLYQERQYRERNWAPLPVEPSSIAAVLLTHAHLDHCGYLPKLVKDGFRGRVIGTTATCEIARIVLLDAGHLQEEDAAFKQRRHAREGRTGPHPEVPLYTAAEAEACFEMFTPVDYYEPVAVTEGIEATFYDAGHILGAAAIKVNCQIDGTRRSVLFTGDLGRNDKPILRDPDIVDGADYVLVESTYGNRVHEPTAEVEGKLIEAIDQTRQAGGNVVIPSFAIERAQELLFHLNGLMNAERLSRIMVFLDSPMAIKVTEVFKRHPEMFDEQTRALWDQGDSPFGFPGLQMTSTTKQSKAINHIRGTVIIIAGSGMCTGGRIKHHLVNNIERPESTILFVGYQAAGTLGRLILDGTPQVRILGQTRTVRARIARIHGFSAHADREEMTAWLKHLKAPPRQVFITHGEPEAARGLQGYLQAQLGWKSTVPAYGDEVVLD